MNLCVLGVSVVAFELNIRYHRQCVLLGRAVSVRTRLLRLAAGTALALLPILVWYTLASLRFVVWPEADSRLGVVLGLAGAVIIFFEMALAPRKWLRGRRLGAAKVWMRWHVWLGLAVLPMIVIHSGFAWGGPLSAVTMVLFLIVIASGIWGLAMQQFLPKKLLDDVPGETVASQIDYAISTHITEARRIVDELDVPRLNDFYKISLHPYLEHGRRGTSVITSATECSRQFANLRLAMPGDTVPLLQLETIAGLRRTWDRQARLNLWLHNWQIIHMPASVLMTGLMIVHALYAMKWW